MKPRWNHWPILWISNYGIHFGYPDFEYFLFQDEWFKWDLLYLNLRFRFGSPKFWASYFKLWIYRFHLWVSWFSNSFWLPLNLKFCFSNIFPNTLFYVVLYSEGGPPPPLHILFQTHPCPRGSLFQIWNSSVPFKFYSNLSSHDYIPSLF